MNIVKSNRIHCNRCKKVTQHTARGEHIQAYSEDYSVEVVTTENGFQILECDQCRSVSFRQFVHFSEFQEHPGDLDPEDTLHPPRTRRQQPEWVTRDWIDESSIYKLLHEFYTALDASIPWLASIGARTIFDVFSSKTVGDIGNFSDKLDELVSKGTINQQERDHLEVLVEAGHASAHRGYHPSDDDLNIITDILEATLYKHFVEPKKLNALNNAAQLVKSKIPPRPPHVPRKTKNKSSKEIQ